MNTIRILKLIKCFIIAFAGYTFMAGCMLTAVCPLPTVQWLAPICGFIITVIAFLAVASSGKENDKH